MRGRAAARPVRGYHGTLSVLLKEILVGWNSGDARRNRL